MRTGIRIVRVVRCLGAWPVRYLQRCFAQVRNGVRSISKIHEIASEFLVKSSFVDPSSRRSTTAAASGEGPSTRRPPLTHRSPLARPAELSPRTAAGSPYSGAPAPRQGFAFDRGGLAPDRHRVSETARRSVLDTGSASRRDSSAGGSALTAAEIRQLLSQGKSRQKVVLGRLLEAWAGPLSVKTKILKAHAQDSEMLKLERENISSLPNGISLLPRLRIINLNGNPSLQELPSDLVHAPALERIQANECDLRKLPENIGEARALIMLDVNDNRQLEALPGSMADLQNLEVIEAARCDLTRLPEGGFGPAVTRISLQHNPRLDRLPEKFASGPSIKHLDLEGCSLTHIPAGVASLPELKWLNLGKNAGLQHIPPLLDLKRVHVVTRGSQIRLMDLVLSQPISPEVRKEYERRFRKAQKYWSTIQKRIATGGANVSQKARAARLDVDRARAGVSDTARSTLLAGRNWEAADRQVRQWVEQGYPLDTEHLKQLNALLGRDVQPFGDPEAVEKFEARFGEFRRMPTGFPQDGSRALVVDEREVGAEMAHFDEWFEQASAQVAQGRMNPAELSAATVQRLISIHPFADANGRTARLAGDWVLMSHGLPPAASPKKLIIVFSEGRNFEGPEQALASTIQGLANTVEMYGRHLGLKIKAP
ncbi:filamentation induced by cAMP protein Fic [Paracidovorax citrulli AAC00-1]|uniref:Filamentation induced by cAMP protein Fic n=1 Tax=Paracidovorax citrulli (strain AAC00-1) TaxID=397945 RepID=A1TMA9_PARC0|nr:filamentation induced by cAMP protein Fic [Paracidovorax citrulli AAC00-1]